MAVFQAVKGWRFPTQEMDEHHHQIAVMRWAESMSLIKPELRLLYAIPNGGKRHWMTGKKMKAEGVKAGVPDMCLPVARRGFHGLYVELKTPKGRPSPIQRDWIDALTGQGYAARCAYGYRQAIEIIEDYIDGKGTPGGAGEKE